MTSSSHCQHLSNLVQPNPDLSIVDTLISNNIMSGRITHVQCETRAAECCLAPDKLCGSTESTHGVGICYCPSAAAASSGWALA